MEHYLTVVLSSVHCLSEVCSVYRLGSVVAETVCQTD